MSDIPDRLKAFLMGFAEGNRVLFTVAQDLFGVKVKNGPQTVVTLSEEARQQTLLMAQAALKDGLLQAVFSKPTWQSLKLVDSLELTHAGLKAIGKTPRELF